MSAEPRLSERATWPLSPAQEGMRFEALARPQSGGYIEQVTVGLESPANGARLRAAWRACVARHAILRTSFTTGELSEPVQVVRECVDPPFEEIDLRECPSAEREVRLRSILDEDRRRGFDLQVAPPMRLALIRLDDHRDLLLWTVHHIAVDGRSIKLLLHEVFNDYDGLPVPDAPIPFHAYARWQRDQPTAHLETYWRARLAGLAESASLPLPEPGDGVVHAGASPIRRYLEPALTQALTELAATHGLTMNTLLLGAWALLAHRYADAEDIVIGATKSVRYGAQAPVDGIGPYINTLPVRTSLDAHTPAIEWLQRLREQWVALRDVEHTPLDVLRACCAIPGDAPLYQLHYVFEHRTLCDELRRSGGAWAGREVALEEHTPVPLMLACYGGESVLTVIEFDAERFAAPAVDRLSRHLLQMLRALVESPDAPAARLPLMPPEETEALLRAWRGTPARPPAMFAPGYFERTAAETPDAIAVRYLDVSLTYAVLNRRANQFARRLRGLGVGPGHPVGMVLPNTPDAMISLLAILKAGGVYVPMDPAYPADRLQFLLEDSGAMVLIADGATAARLDTDGVRVLEPPSEHPSLARYSGENLGVPIGGADLAYIIYTSGSSGRPKGVCVAHGEAAAHFEAIGRVYGLTRSDRVLQIASLSFDVSLEQIFAPWVVGALVHLADEGMHTAADFSAVLRESGITMLNLAPAFWQQWMAEGLARGLDDLGEQFRLLVVGSDIVLPATVHQWRANPRLRSVALMNAYGPTEAVITSFCYPIPEDFDPHGHRARVPIGWPVPGTEMLILDRFQNPMPCGLPGELHLGGNRLARGYLGRSDLTAAGFIDDPIEPASGRRFYRSGDRVRQLDDGAIDFLGRTDDQVKIRGFRIELREIVAALLRCPGVREAAARCWPVHGGEHQLVGYVVPEAGASLEGAEVRRHLGALLPSFMVPQTVCVLDAFPINVNGKLDHKSLPEPRTLGGGARGPIVLPTTRTQRLLFDCWREALDRADFGIEDRFFDLGGHSLRAARVVTRVQAEFGVSVPLGAFMQAPTIAALARLVDGGEDQMAPESGDSCVVSLQDGTVAPPLFCVLGAGSAHFAYGPLASHLGVGRHILGLQYTHLPEHKALDSVEAVAARYWTAIRTVQPRGPYLLAGWSFGGLVAFELARLIHGAGDTVGLLAIIDCEAQAPAQATPARFAANLKFHVARTANRLRIIFRTRDLLLRHLYDIARLLANSASTKRGGGATLREYLQFVQSDLINAYALRQAGLQAPENRLSRLDVAGDDFVRKVVAGLKANANSGRAYTMAPYDGTVHLYRTTGVPGGFGPGDVTLGFDRIARSVVVEFIDANHYTLVREPAVGELAARLSAHLAEARARAAEGPPATTGYRTS